MMVGEFLEDRDRDGDRDRQTEIAIAEVPVASRKEDSVSKV